MTPDEARERIEVMRAELRRAMRCVSVPEPDWNGAAGALDNMSEELMSLWVKCKLEHLEEMSHHGNR